MATRTPRAGTITHDDMRALIKAAARGGMQLKDIRDIISKLGAQTDEFDTLVTITILNMVDEGVAF